MLELKQNSNSDEYQKWIAKRRTEDEYAAWLSSFDFECFVTLRLPPLLPSEAAIRYFRDEVLLKLCRSNSSRGNRICAVTVITPGHVGFQQRHLHAAVATRNRDINHRISEFLVELPDSMNEVVCGRRALDIIPFRHFDDLDTKGKKRPGHPRYMARHLTGPEDLSVYGKEFLKTINRSQTHGN